MRYLQDLGFTVAPCVAELTIGESAFFDTVATVVGEAQISSVSPRTALSLTWGLDALVEALAQAAAAADA